MASSAVAVTISTAIQFPFSQLAAAFSAAFGDYMAGPVELNSEGLARFISSQGVDLCFSRVALRQNEIAAFAFINRTGDISRLAAMGVIPSARGKGFGLCLMEHVVSEARQRADRLLTLEVFEQNPPALNLYRKLGFKERGRLIGWHLTRAESSLEPALQELSLVEACEKPARFAYPDIPWQVSRHACAKLPPGSRAFGLGASFAGISSAQNGPVQIRCLQQASLRPAPDWAELRELVAGLFSIIPNRRWLAPAIFPEMFGREVFEPLGFARESLNQFYMLLEPLASA